MDAFSFLSVFAIIIVAATSTASTNLDGFYANNVNLTASRYKRQCPSLVGCAPSTQLPLIPGRTNCVLPELPDNGKWTVFDGPTKYPGEIVPSKTVLQFQCDSNFKLLPEIEFSVCYKFWSAVPVCLKTCHSLHSTQLMHISCQIDNQETSCNDPYNGSVARVTCASSRLNKYLKCINGKWDASLPTCKPGPNCKFEYPDINDESITSVALGEFSFMAIIGYKSKNNPNATTYSCVGALISQCYVIFPAHCSYYRFFGGPYIVRFGSLKPTTDESGVQDVLVKEVKVHPDYKASSSSNDVALIRLEKPVTLNNHVQPISITKSEAIDGRGIVIGWAWHDNLNDNESLKRTTMEPITIDDCIKKFPEDAARLSKNVDGKTLVCLTWTNSSYPRVSTPMGVLVTENEELPCKYSLVSIHAFGWHLYANVDQKVYPYLEWINSVMETC